MVRRSTAEWAGLTVAAQEQEPDSTLAFFRRAIALRHGRGAIGEVEFPDAAPGVMILRSADGVTCVLNTGTAPIPLAHGELLIASSPLVDGKLVPDAAAWVR